VEGKYVFIRDFIKYYLEGDQTTKPAPFFDIGTGPEYINPAVIASSFEWDSGNFG
jgi:hypothetical protein